MAGSNKSSRKIKNPKLRSQQFEKTKRGKLKIEEKEKKSNISAWVLGFLIFVVVGSSLFQIIRTASTGGRQ